MTAVEQLTGLVKQLDDDVRLLRACVEAGNLEGASFLCESAEKLAKAARTVCGGVSETKTIKRKH